jgi:3-oxoacyl-[acyl-carrier protein] reductase
MDLGLRGKGVVVTGGTRGIGRAIAESFASEGANLAICARTGSALGETAVELRRNGVLVHAAACDVGEPAALDGFLEGARQALGQIDVLVNNVAGVGFADDDEAWQVACRVTLLSAVRGSTKVAPWMQAQGGGSIIHISSIAALEAGWPASYAATKAALVSHAKSAAVALASSKVRVNVLALGSIEFPGGVWDQVKQGNRPMYDAVVSTIPSGRMGTPEEVASAVVFLGSDRASWITGACLTIDGGQHRGNL